MKMWFEKKWFERVLEIIPGFMAWSFLISPFILAFLAPAFLSLFLLFYGLYWLAKSLNISRHLVSGFLRLRRDMKINWLEMCKKTTNIKKLQDFLSEKYTKDRKKATYQELLAIENLCGKQKLVKNWQDIYHVILFAVSNEGIDIVEPSIQSVLNLNYPMDKVILVFAAEDRFEDGFKSYVKKLEKKYASKFKDFRSYYHKVAPGEVIGKGPNITFAGKEFWKDYKNKGIKPENILLTNLDADHIMHPEYCGKLTYLYVTDPNRDRKSYQPVPLLFNNIWDAPAMNRVAAASSSFWQIIESMRPYKLRTFAAHTQSLAMLLVTDFWSVKTIVEDGHQYYRTYFALNGDHHMVPLTLPVYQDAVLGEGFWDAMWNQYRQKRRWSWGVSDFPYIVINSIRHKEIPLFERFIQIFRHFAGLFSWSTSSFFLALAWIPLALNRDFQDMVLAHNIMAYTSGMLRIAWVGIFANIWISLILLPKRPRHYSPLRNILMFTQWIFAPVYAILLSATPALESQTRLMLGKKLDVFWITPKIRKNTPEYHPEKN
jgi:hypothetical protein